jgi:hypothetical protein
MGLFKNLLGNGGNDVHSSNKGSLLSAAELNFMNILLKIVDEKSFFVFPKVSVNQCISIPDKDKAKQILATKCIDYVICDRDTCKPILGIELDDSTNNRSEMADRDFLLSKAFENADVALIRVDVQREYDMDDIAQRVFNGLGMVHNDILLVK